MWVIDIRHWLDENLSGPGVPQLRFKVKKLTEIITFATAIKAGISVNSPPVCWRRPKRKACLGKLEIDFDPDTDQIHWVCPECGDEGVVTGWRGLIWDLTDSASEVLH
jgi:RNA polymerase subunit RPABC4/transcription elongation factor Spt4